MPEITKPIIFNETGVRMAAALEDISRGGNADAIDATYEAMLDGTNTSKIFAIWWPLSNNGDTRYQRLDRWFTMLARVWGEKRYTLRYYKDTVSSSSEMTPQDDLVGKSAAQLCTENATPVADWADEDPMTWYVRANAKSLADGTMNILAIEGESEFDLHGETAPVYTFCMALWLRTWEEGDYNYKSWATVNHGGYAPYEGDVAPDGSKRVMTWRPTFPGSLDAGGALTSGVGGKPYLWAAATTGLTAARKQTAYEGLWNDADAIWALDMWQLRHFNLENSGVCEGCQSYNYQYHCALGETDVHRILLTTAQAENLQVGSNIEIGEQGSGTSNDRNTSYNYSIARYAKILSIESVTIDGTTYAAVTVDTENAFTTTTTTLVSTMPWDSGNTEHLPGHKDGACHSLLAGQNPMRVQGVEMMSGAYDVGIEPLYNVTAGSDATHWNYNIYACRDSVNLAGSVTANHVLVHTASDIPQGWNYVKAFWQTILAVLFPLRLGGSTSTYYKSGFYGAYSAGVRVPWRYGDLGNDVNAGLAYEYGNVSPSSSGWVGRPRLCGSGKKRGEWAA